VERRPQSAPERRGAGRGAKIALAVVSVLVMSLTGYAWAAMQGLVNGLTMTDVIGSGGGGEKPADGARDILLVGLDSRTDAQGNPLSKEVLAQLRAGVSDGELNTDTLIVVHIPNDGSKAVALSLPRDSYVDIPGGYGKHKINSAYARAKTAATRELQAQGVSAPKDLELRSNQEGAKTLISTVQKLTGFTVDNYAAINLLGFNDITQAIGGVDVCLNANVKDSYSGANFRAGPQTLAGVDALAFVRQRHGLPRGDLDRVVRQQVFMASLARKMLSAGTLTDPTKLNGLIDSVKKSVVLNQGWDILAFAQQMRGLTGGQLQFRTIPVVNMDYKTLSDGSAIQVDPKQVHEFVRSLTGPAAGQPAPPPDSSANHAVTVDVRNASGRTGLAADAAQTLSGQGFAPGDTANATARRTSVVRVPKGQQAAGQKIADALGGSMPVEEDPAIGTGHATVFLGSDYSSQAASGSGTGGGAAEAASPKQAPAQPPAGPGDPNGDKPITADGITCVN
jgi:LCP family protein required for cell wall assembly